MTNTEIEKIKNVNIGDYKYGDWRTIESDYENITSTSLLDPNKYPTYVIGYVFDENKSVKWNREEVERLNNIAFTELKNEEKRRKELQKNIEHIIINLIAKELINRELFNDMHIAIIKANKLFSRAWEEKHSYGLYDVCVFADFLVGVVEDFVWE